MVNKYACLLNQFLIPYLIKYWKNNEKNNFKGSLNICLPHVSSSGRNRFLERGDESSFGYAELEILNGHQNEGSRNLYNSRTA